MKHFLLQINPQPVVDNGTNMLFQYGVLGLFALIMIAVIYYMEKQRTKREDDIKNEKQLVSDRLAKLEQRFQDYQDDDRKEMERTMHEMKEVMEANKRVMDGTSELMKELKQLLINNRT